MIGDPLPDPGWPALGGVARPTEGEVFGTDDYIARYPAGDARLPRWWAYAYAERMVDHVDRCHKPGMPTRPNDPRPGDFVALPYDAAWREPAVNRCGWVVSCWSFIAYGENGMRWTGSYETPGVIRCDTGWLILTIDGRLISWGNCSPRAMPRGDEYMSARVFHLNRYRDDRPWTRKNAAGPSQPSRGIGRFRLRRRARASAPAATRRRAVRLPSTARSVARTRR